jgi:hypothetical protein
MCESDSKPPLFSIALDLICWAFANFIFCFVPFDVLSLLESFSSSHILIFLALLDSTALLFFFLIFSLDFSSFLEIFHSFLRAMALINPLPAAPPTTQA